MPADYSIKIDWNKDGDYSDAGEDVTSRVLDRAGLAIEYGRDVGQVIPSNGAPATAGFHLNNASGDYSPENDSSPLTGLVLPRRPVLIEATHASTTYTLYRGALDKFDLLPGWPDRSVQVGCLDGLAALVGVDVTTDLHPALQTGQALHVILDAAGWPADLRDIDQGASTIRWFVLDQADAWQAVQDVAATEGMAAFVYIGPDGEFVFRDRHHRLTRAASTTSQATFRASGTEPLFSAPLAYDHGWGRVVNDVTFQVDERDPSGELTVVWSSEKTYSIADGQTLPVTAATGDPFTGAVIPIGGIDYMLRTGAVSVTLSRTAGRSATLFVKATGGPAVITGLQLRAYPVTVMRTVQVHGEDTTSIDRYERRSWPGGTPPWLNANDAAALADLILAQRAERLPVITMRVVSGQGYNTRLTQQLARDLSDRVHVIEPDFGIDDDFYLEHIAHNVDEAGLVHDNTFTLEKVPTVPGNLFTFDVAGKGFDDGVFAQQGLDDPDTMFRFDVSGQGFDEGLLAT